VYAGVHVAFMIRATLINTHEDRQDRQTDKLDRHPGLFLLTFYLQLLLL